MASRLDRLFLLVETGSNQETRKAAAKQLGEVVKSCPGELFILLNRLRKLIYHSSWDTRVAAVQAVESILSNVPQWHFPVSVKEEVKNKATIEGRVRLDTLDIKQVLADGKMLLAKQASAFDVPASAATSMNPEENLAWQRSQLNKKLGLTDAAKLGIDTSGLFSNDDLMVETTTKSSSDGVQQQQGQRASSAKNSSCNTESPGTSEEKSSVENPGNLSSRQLNRLKRKAKQQGQACMTDSSCSGPKGSPFTHDGGGPSGEGQHGTKKLKSDKLGSTSEGPIDNETDEQVDLSPPGWGQSLTLTGSGWEGYSKWPFQRFSSDLLMGLMSPVWERRHGSAMALRELLTAHGRWGKAEKDETKVDLNAGAYIEWLEDVTVSLVCILALDKFSDFVSDQVVAPVRESAAQALGTAATLMDISMTTQLAGHLNQLLDEEAWTTRHGGQLGLKYVLAVSDMKAVSVVLGLAYPRIFAGLTDSVDDVASVAAAALLPIVPHILESRPDDVPDLLKVLWESLLDLDDLTSSTNSILLLLANILSDPVGLQIAVKSSANQLHELVPRIFPFVSHVSTHVRKAALQTLIILAGRSPTNQLWLPHNVLVLLRLVFQRSLLEPAAACRDALSSLWNMVCEKTPLEPLLMAACPWFGPWITLISSPANMPLDSTLLLTLPNNRNCDSQQDKDQQSQPQKIVEYLGGREALAVIVDPVERERHVSRARNLAARLLGKLAAYIIRPMPGMDYGPGKLESPLDMLLSRVLVPQLGTMVAYQKLAIAVIIIQWLEQQNSPPELHNTSLPGALLANLTSQQTLDYSELSIKRSRLNSDYKDFLSTLKHYKLELGGLTDSPTHAELQRLTESSLEALGFTWKLRPNVVETITERQTKLRSVFTSYMAEASSLDRLTQAMLAGALAYLGPKCLPDKLNPIVRPLMESIKHEPNEDVQAIAAKSLTLVVDWCLKRGQTGPATKIVTNVCSFLCSHPEQTPRTDLAHFDDAVDKYLDILSLYLSERQAEKALQQKPRGGGKSKRTSPALDGVNPTADPAANEPNDLAKIEVKVKGAEKVICQVVQRFGASLFTQLPILDELTVAALADPTARPQDVVNALRILSVMLPVMHPDLLNGRVKDAIVDVISLTLHPATAVRFMASGCLTAAAHVLPAHVMAVVVSHLLLHVDNAERPAHRQGVIEAVAGLTNGLGLRMVPYIALFVLTVLGRMTDSRAEIRALATITFAELVRLMPLAVTSSSTPAVKDDSPPDESSTPTEAMMKSNMKRVQAEQQNFVDQLMNSKQTVISNSELGIDVSVELRSYQLAGFSWLAFLRNYNLHGILCDDMGLGKTLQTICILAKSHHEDYEAKINPKVADGRYLPEETGLRSLVICPATLGGHWMEEVDKFVGNKHLRPFMYIGNTAARVMLRECLTAGDYNLVVTSYDIVRNDIDFLSGFRWHYVVLDEGHVVRNSKSKTFLAIKQLDAKHRLILSGTPIQNSVTELWTLFDFLMPGYLGSEKQFYYRYAKPILASREAKSNSKEVEAGILALEALHRQTLPFILRRLKEEVLSDLPPKITQDYYCHLSPLQERLYEEYMASQAKEKSDAGEEDSTRKKTSKEDDNTGSHHVFQTLQFLKKVCNHPKLVLNPQHSSYQDILRKDLGGKQSNLGDIRHSGKLLALKQLLVDLGIASGSDSPTGADNRNDGLAGAGSVVSPHRALVFCQLKVMIDIVEDDLLKVHCPGVSYLRLDGSVPVQERHNIASRFNNDPSIDLLLLSTSVGGLGLNLTGADTVIFVEHDWNPMKDLQAMDRAHRIGQKRVVNVYRLITRSTLEEKIMSLQKFKLYTANTVISGENSSMKTMNTDQILDLFTLDRSNDFDKKKKEDDTGLRSLLSNLPELWDETQYEEEYDLTNYVAKTKNKK